MTMPASEDVVTPRELEVAFLGTNFGGADHRQLLHASVLKKAVGYHCGHTITCIMQELRLIGKNGNLLERGRMLLRTDADLHKYMLRSG